MVIISFCLDMKSSLNISDEKVFERRYELKLRVLPSTTCIISLLVNPSPDSLIYSPFSLGVKSFFNIAVSGNTLICAVAVILLLLLYVAVIFTEPAFAKCQLTAVDCHHSAVICRPCYVFV